MGRLVGLLALLVSLAVLVASGRALPAPVWSAFGAWVERVGPVVAAVALVRVAALLATALLLALRAVAVGAEALGAVRLAARLDRALPPRMRRVLGGVVGVGVSGSVLLTVGSGPATSAAASGGGSVPVATMTQLDVATMRVEDVDDVDEPEATMEVVDEVVPQAEVDAPAPVDEWLVEPGDSFWSIAEDVVGDRLGRPGSEAEVAAYWGRLVEANRPGLVSGDPDLIYPGQRFTLVA